jgi:YVTN family beta-propeller protein
MAITPNSACAYITNDASGTVSVISTATNTVTTTITGLNHPGVLAVTTNGANVIVAGGGTVSVINATTNTVTATIPVGSDPGGVVVTPNGAYAYVTNQGNNTVSVINISAFSTATIKPTEPFVFSAVDGLTVVIVILIVLLFITLVWYRRRHKSIEMK